MGQEETKVSTQKQRKFWMQDCAFLRISPDGNGCPIFLCLLKKGKECCKKDMFPSGEPCAQAVKKVPMRDLRKQKQFWDGVAKHNKKKNVSRDSAYKHKTTGKEEYKFCKRKTRYPTEAKAKEMKRKCEERRGVPLRVLYCPYCKGWHLTHKYADKTNRFWETPQETGTPPQN